MRTCSLALLLAAAGCASQQPQPTLVSSADAIGYAVRYPARLASEAETFAAHKRQAHDMSGAVVGHVREVKTGAQGALLSQVVDQADADGRRESYASAQRQDRALRDFWEDERGPIAARASAAAQKQVSDAGCTTADTQPAVQQALRAGVDRQLERRLRAQSEAQRLLEKSKAQLSAATLSSMQRLADEIARASYLVNVALIEDSNALNHSVGELSSVEATLERAFAEEQQQASVLKGAEQKAADERLQQIRASYGALGASRDKAQRELTDTAQQVQLARDEYARALAAVRAALTPPVTAPVAPPAAKPATASASVTTTAPASQTH